VKHPRSIAITGASSGIGEALAHAYAGPGVTLTLCGRNGDRIMAVAEACRAKGANADGSVRDVTDATAMASWIHEAEARAPLDLIIANAGIAAGSDGGGPAHAADSGGGDQTRRIFAVNMDGVINTVLPALGPLRERRRGQIAIVSSLAGYRGFPGAPAYSASKAAAKAWGEALRGQLHGDGVEVSVICPGYVTTRMTAQNKFPMPLLMNSERAAAIIIRGLERNRGLIAFPLLMHWVAWAIRSAPMCIMDPLLRMLPGKE
jgi:short-subunit dehydrogenase